MGVSGQQQNPWVLWLEGADVAWYVPVPDPWPWCYNKTFLKTNIKPPINNQYD